MCETIHQGL